MLNFQYPVVLFPVINFRTVNVATGFGAVDTTGRYILRRKFGHFGTGTLHRRQQSNVEGILWSICAVLLVETVSSYACITHSRQISRSSKTIGSVLERCYKRAHIHVHPYVKCFPKLFAQNTFDLWNLLPISDIFCQFFDITKV